MSTPHNTLLNLAAKVRALGNAFIERRLAEEGAAGLAPSHGGILAALYAQGPLSMARLSACIRRDKSTVTVLVRKLESFGYVRRETGSTDQRVTMVSLTEKGVAFQPAFERISEELNQRLWGDADAATRRALCEGLQAVIDRM